jgi:hypothetical protein
MKMRRTECRFAAPAPRWLYRCAVRRKLLEFTGESIRANAAKKRQS